MQYIVLQNANTNANCTISGFMRFRPFLIKLYQYIAKLTFDFALIPKAETLYKIAFGQIITLQLFTEQHYMYKFCVILLDFQLNLTLVWLQFLHHFV